jgi:DNA repair exonuclease SbcCD ATPase subunit
MILLHRLTTKDFKQLSDVSLHFPDQGTILIEGHNEAGKSSLFEAVYFALYGDALNGANLSDLKRYGAETMRVELDFSINGRRFRIERTLRQNQKARLVCPTPEGGQEEITSLTEAKKRILTELSISASALLNTCFVEQKKLDQLESLNPNVRRETINELLNIEVLNVLEKEFKVTGEDYSKIQLAKDRVAIAESDASQPGLENDERTAWRCMQFQQAQECQDEIHRIEGEIREAQKNWEANEDRLTQIASALQRGEEYLEQLKAIREALPLHVAAWQTALMTYATASEDERSLLALQERLPERRKTLAQYEQWEDSLRILEELESAAKTLVHDLEQRQAAVQSYDDLLAEWKNGEEQTQRLDRQQEQEQAALTSARVAWEARQHAIQRAGRLALLLQQADTHDNALRDAEALATELHTAEDCRDALPAAQNRVGQLEKAGNLLNQRTADIKRFGEVQENLRACQRRKEEYDAAQKQVVQQEEELQQLSGRIAQSQSQVQTVWNTLQQSEQRKALLDWAEAAERCAEADPNTGKLADMNARRAQAEEQLHTAIGQVTVATRQQVPGFASMGGGAVLCVVAFFTPLGVPLLAVGILLAILGGGFVFKARQAVIEAQSAEKTAREACDKLDLERKWLEERVKEYADQLERRKAAEETQRKALLNLNLSVPASSEAARKQAAETPDVDVVAARQAYDTAKAKFDDLKNEREVLAGGITQEKDRLARQNIGQVHQNIEKLEAEAKQFIQSLEEANQILPSLLETLGIGEELEQVQTVLAQARTDAAAYEAAAKRIPTLSQQEAEKRILAQKAWNDAQILAEELSLAGDTLDTWRSSATAERQVLETERHQAGDERLRDRWQEADKTLKAKNEALAVLKSKQEERRQELDAQDRDDLERQVGEKKENIQANADSQKPLLPVRAALQSAELPTIFHPLQTRLSLLRAKLADDEKKAAQLETVQPQVEQCRKEIEQKAEKFAQAWNANLPDYATPATAEEAQECLPDMDKEIADKYRALDVPALEQEQESLRKQNKQIGEDNAARAHQQSELDKQIWERYAALGISESDKESPIMRFPELEQAAQHTAKEWAEKYDQRREELIHAKADRRARADSLGLGDTPLILEEEREDLANAEKALDVKRCAETIIKSTRKSIVERVMPMTLQNVRFLLPALTMGRYKDLDWQGDADSLLIYDERAGEHKRKRVFSGGAKDQISLALRLGFALATLPTGKTSRPYWLFLDEPLSSFDRDRTRALVDLLTKGVVRQHFRQIFLVSHSESFDPSLFDFRVRMENGSVAESNLPQLAA